MNWKQEIQELTKDPRVESLEITEWQECDQEGAMPYMKITFFPEPKAKHYAQLTDGQEIIDCLYGRYTGDYVKDLATMNEKGYSCTIHHYEQAYSNKKGSIDMGTFSQREIEILGDALAYASEDMGQRDNVTYTQHEVGALLARLDQYTYPKGK